MCRDANRALKARARQSTSSSGGDAAGDAGREPCASPSSRRMPRQLGSQGAGAAAGGGQAPRRCEMRDGQLTPTRLRGKDPRSANLRGRGRCLSPTRCRTEPRAASCSGRRGGPSADGAASRGWGRRQCYSSRARTRARRDWQEDLVNGGTQRRRVVYRKNTPNAPFSPQGPIQSPRRRRRRRRDPASVVRLSFHFAPARCTDPCAKHAPQRGRPVR